MPLVSQLLEKSFAENSKCNALWVKGTYYTYNDLSQSINSIKKLLLPYKDRRKPIAIITHDHHITYASILASLITGVGFVPISPSFPHERRLKIIKLSGSNLLISTKEEDNPNTEIHFISTHTLPLSESPLIEEDITEHHSVACILFTSGSTGDPKGVPMTYRNIDTTLDSYFSLGYGPEKGGRSLQMFEFTFDMSLISYLPAFLNGACVYSIVDDKMRFFSAFKIMKDYELTFAVFVPSTLAFMRKYFTNMQFPALRCCMVGGEPFPVNLAAEWAKSAPNARIINISGPTETTMACMGYEFNRDIPKNKHLNGILAFGKPWKNTQAVVIDENQNVLLPGIKGELCFAGENVMKGYINNTDRNKEAFFTKTINGKDFTFYRTGDGAYIDEEEDFFTCGRIDFQVKIQGYRVEPEEIEAVTRKIIPNIMVAAIPYKKHDGFYAIRLFIDSGKEEIKDLKQAFLAQLPPYMVPEEITILSPMPLNTNGKIDRNFLRQSLEKLQPLY